MWHSFLTGLAKIAIFPIALLLSASGYQSPAQQQLSSQMSQFEAQYNQSSQNTPVFGSTLPIAGNTYNLAGSGVSGSATTITLTSLTIKQTGQPIQDADVGDIFYITIEPGSNTKQEIVSCTTVGANAGGTVQLSGCSRGLSPISPYTASTSLQFTHAGGSQVIFSNPPQLFNQYAALANSQSITGQWTFSTTPTITNNAVNPTDAVNYATLIATAFQGAATSTFSILGLTQLATQTQVGASTASSTAGAPLVLTSKFSTTTCQSTGSNVLVASSTTGKLAGGCLDTTSNSYSWTKPQTFGNLTTTATTTIPATSTTTNPIVLNSIPYAFPGTQGASSSVLSTDSKGSLSWITASTTITQVTATFTSPGNANTASQTATCGTGGTLVGGGFRGLIQPPGNSTNAVVTMDDGPSSSNSWFVQLACDGNSCITSTVTVYAMCLNKTP